VKSYTFFFKDAVRGAIRASRQPSRRRKVPAGLAPYAHVTTRSDTAQFEATPAFICAGYRLPDHVG